MFSDSGDNWSGEHCSKVGIGKSFPPQHVIIRPRVVCGRSWLAYLVLSCGPVGNKEVCRLRYLFHHFCTDWASVCVHGRHTTSAFGQVPRSVRYRRGPVRVAVLDLCDNSDEFPRPCPRERKHRRARIVLKSLDRTRMNSVVFFRCW